MSRAVFIIGNGFDRFLGIESSFQDFHKYMISKWPDGQMLSNQLEDFFPALDDNSEPLLWSDFEKALGIMDKNNVLNYCQIGHNFENYENLSHYVYDIEDGPDTYLSSILSDLDDCFQAWVNSLAIYGGNMSIPYFHRGALFFSFNYTETLENIFKVPQQNVCHIHGKRSVSDQYIYGHNIKSEPLFGDTCLEDYVFERIEYYYRGLFKDTNKQITANKSFFDKIKESNINSVIVYGCSLGEIDFPYFVEINKCISNDAKWLFSVYNKMRDVKAVKRLISLLGLDKTHCQTFDFIRN